MQHRGVTYHTFPVNAATRAAWLANCRFPANKPINKSVLICSRHFRRVDFQPLKNNKYLLKAGSEPSIFPWTHSSNTGSSNSSSSSVDASAAAAAAASSSSGTDESSSKLQNADSSGAGPSTPKPSTSAAAAAAAAKQSSEERIVNQILSDAIKSEMKSPIKRSASADVGPGGSNAEPKAKQQRKSLDSVLFKKTNDNAAAAAAAAAATVDPASLFVPGVEIEAQDFKEVWHPAQVMEVDQVDGEVLIHFETASIK